MATYRAYNKRLLSWASAEIPDVLDTKALAGVYTASGSNIITVTSTTGVFPGMGLSVPNIPRGAFVQSIKSATEIVAFAPSLDVTTGEWTVTAAAAYATATTTPNVPMTGHAHGFNPVPIPEAITNGDVWRNTISDSLPVSDGLRVQTPSSPSGTYVYTNPDLISGGVVPKEDAVITTISDGAAIPLIAADKLTVAIGDDKVRKPYRAKTRWRHNHWLVSSTGNISTIPADVDIVVQLIESTPAA